MKGKPNGPQLRLARTRPEARAGLEGLELVKAILDDWRYGRAIAAETLAALDAAVPDDREEKPDARGAPCSASSGS